MIKRLILPLKIHGQKGVMYSMSYNSIFTLNKYQIHTIKKNYKHAILDQIILMKKIVDPIFVTFIFHRKDKHGFDLDNWGFCQAKMLFDSLQNNPGTLKKPNKLYIPYMEQILTDDTTVFIKGLSFLDGEINKEKPHCECIIEKIEKII